MSSDNNNNNSSNSSTTNSKKQPPQQRTIQVKIGNGVSRTMTPDAAADYLRQVAGKGWGVGGARELKMTFDNGSTSTVSLPRTSGGNAVVVDTTNTNTNTTNTNTNASSCGSGSTSLAAAVAGAEGVLAGIGTMGAAMNSSTSAIGGGVGGARSDGMPCSEKEMKALMSMFVEIMGLQMNTDRLNQTPMAFHSSSEQHLSTHSFKKNKNKNLPEETKEELELPYPPMPKLVEIPAAERPRMAQLAAAHRKKAALQARSRHTAVEPIPPVPGSNATNSIANVMGPVTGVQGIAPFEWGAIERVAIEDALEQEERIRKDSSKGKSNSNTNQKNSNSNSSYGKRNSAQHDTAVAMQNVEAANKKLCKAITVWRTRVAAAVTANDTAKLTAFLEQSPLPLHAQAASDNATTAALYEGVGLCINGNTNRNTNSNGDPFYKNPHLEFLVPLTVPKSRLQNHAKEARKILTEYLLQEFSHACFFAIGRNGRSAVHTACLYADLTTLQLVAERLRNTQQQSIWTVPCQDSGWTPLHYAAASGSLRAVECVLQYYYHSNSNSKNSNNHNTTVIRPAELLEQTTNCTATWKKGTPHQGLTVTALVEALASGRYDKKVESHGMALPELVEQYRLASSATASSTGIHTNSEHSSAACGSSGFYLWQLQAILQRLREIQTHGYAPLPDKEVARLERELVKQWDQEQKKLQPPVMVAAAVETMPNRTAHPPEHDKNGDNDDDDKKVREDTLVTVKTAMTDDSVTVASVEVADAKSKKKKKNKKKYPSVSAPLSNSSVSSSNIDGTVVSAATAQTENKTRSKADTAVKQDPMVVALLGMGFEEAQILAGIQACGGLSRATPDTVVAWIFGGGGSSELVEEETATAPSHKLLSAQQAKQQPPGRNANTGNKLLHNITMEESERLNREAARRKEEERLAAEALVAKREEQRRRNREWNKRQAAQPEAATSAGTSRAKAVAGVSLAPASNFLASTATSAGVRGPSPTLGGVVAAASATTTTSNSTATVTKSTMPTGPIKILTRPSDNKMMSSATRQVGKLNLRDSHVPACGHFNNGSRNNLLDNNFSNDASTVASSVDHGIIEVRENDDATVSTIGSFPVQPPAAAAPPGFANSYSNINAPQAQQWDQHQQPPSTSFASAQQLRSLTLGDSLYGQGNYGPPPGIPETSPLLDHHHQHSIPNHHLVQGHSNNNMRSHSFADTRSNNSLLNPNATTTFGGSTGLSGLGGSSLLGGGPFGDISSHSSMTIPTGLAGLGPSLLSDAFPAPQRHHMERASSAPVQFESPPRHNDLLVSGLSMGFLGGGSNGVAGGALDALVVDNLSTGGGGSFGGPALWGGEHRSGSSLLGNLMQTQQHESTSFRSNSTENHNPFALPPESSLFSASAAAFQPANVQQQQRQQSNNRRWMQDPSTSSHQSNAGGSGDGIW